MRIFTFVTFSTLALSVVGKGGGGRGGGGGSSSGGGSSGGGGGSSSLYYSPAECLSTVGNLRPTFLSNATFCGSKRKPACEPTLVRWLIFDDVDSKVASRHISNHSEADLPSVNSERSVSQRLVLETNWEMEIYDAYYNGTFTMTLEPDVSNATTAQCPKFTSQTFHDAYLRIGPKSRDGLAFTRTVYDSNSFYLSLGRTFKDAQCPRTPNKAYFQMESSSDQLTFGNIWELNATKNDNHFDISGSLTSRRASYNNYYNYLVNTTDPGYSAPNMATNFSCPMVFSRNTITSMNKPQISGTLSAAQANLKWTFNDMNAGYTVTVTFSGAPWKDGALLDMAASTISTTGQSKRVVHKGGIAGWFQNNLKWIIIVVVLVVVSFLAVCLFCCCCSATKRAQRRFKKVAKKKAKESQMLLP